jgi:hypothetical protein
MNFYLSAVDDQLRHPDDQASIGIILCKGRNEVRVMNEAVHGVDVDSKAVAEAVSIGTEFLTELSGTAS